MNPIVVYGQWSLYICIQLSRLSKVYGLVKSNTNTAQFASRRYAGTRLLYFYCPAVSHNCNLYVLSDHLHENIFNI